jgi:sigma-B regulation protein RsbU (phosphoserine phosphatase)
MASTSPINVLFVVQDKHLQSQIRQALRMEDTTMEWHAGFVNNAGKAISTIKNSFSFDIVFTELDLPGTNGLALLDYLQTDYPQIKSVVFSRRDDYQTIRETLNHGAFDFLLIPLDFIDFKQTFEKVLLETVMFKQSVSEHDQLLDLEYELEVAKRIQLTVISNRDAGPAEDHRFELAGHSKPARTVGGDFYDYFLLDEHHLGFVIGDVASRGLPAALFMAICRTVIRSLALQGYPPHLCLQKVNKVLYRESDPSLFIAVFYGILDLQSGEIEYSNGGHTFPYFVDTMRSVNRLDDPGGMVLGVVDQASYPLQKHCLKPGELIFLYTDGFISPGEQEQTAHFESLICDILSIGENQTVPEIISVLFKEMKKRSDNDSIEDDLTAFAVRFNG